MLRGALARLLDVVALSNEASDQRHGPLVLAAAACRWRSISFVIVETTRTSMALPWLATPEASRLRATSTSRHAAHSSAEP